MCKSGGGCPCGPRGPEGPEGPKWVNYVTYLLWNDLKCELEICNQAREYVQKYGSEAVTKFAEFLENMVSRNRPRDLGFYSTLLSTVIREISYKQVSEIILGVTLTVGCNEDS